MNYIESTYIDLGIAQLRTQAGQVTGMLNKQLTTDFMVMAEMAHTQFQNSILNYDQAKEILNDVAEQIGYFLEEQEDDKARRIWK